MTLFRAIAVASLVAMASPARADVQGPPRVVDGDTLEVAGKKVRLRDMDAPEAKQKCADLYGLRYNCGTASTDYLRQLIGSRPVTCKGFMLDRYKRLLAVCYVGDKDLGREMVRAGWAVPYRFGHGSYNVPRDDAKRARRGMWQGWFCDPHDYRRKKCVPR